MSEDIFDQEVRKSQLSDGKEKRRDDPQSKKRSSTSVDMDDEPSSKRRKETSNGESLLRPFIYKSSLLIFLVYLTPIRF